MLEFTKVHCILVAFKNTPQAKLVISDFKMPSFTDLNEKQEITTKTKFTKNSCCFDFKAKAVAHKFNLCPS